MTIATITPFHSLGLKLTDYRTYLLALCFVAGNLVLPQLCHLVPDGGKILLPIYFFTLIASYKFGIRVGLLTAILSPVANHLLFGMPPLALLPVILTKSSLLALAAAIVAGYSRSISLLHLLLVVMAYQLVGGIGEYLYTGSTAMALQDIRLGFPGMILQVVAGWGILKMLAKYEFKKFEEVADRIRRFEFPEEFDMIVAVANGGIVPAALLNQRLNLEFQLLKISLRDKDQRPMYDKPLLVEEIGFPYEGKRILLVEDRVKTGASLEYAKGLLAGAASVKTFAVNGKADYSLYDESCFRFPWIL